MPGIGRITGECASSQASATCRGVAPWPRAISLTAGPRLATSPARDRSPRQERELLALAFTEHVLGRPIQHVVVVLDRHDLDDLLGAL